MTRAELWLVRHAKVAVNGVCYGHADVPTRDDAATAALHIERSAGDAACRWEEIWASPSVRTRTVAAALAQRLGLRVREDERLRELHFGGWEGRSFLQIERENPERFRRWLDRYETEGPPGGESAAELRRRVEAWIHERRRADRTILAVTHAGVIRAARAIATGTGYGDEALREVEHLTVERLSAP